MAVDPDDLIASLENFVMRLKAGEVGTEQVVVVAYEPGEESPRVFHWGPGTARDARCILSDGLYVLQHETIGYEEGIEDENTNDAGPEPTVH